MRSEEKKYILDLEIIPKEVFPRQLIFDDGECNQRLNKNYFL
jgi:hypothetical protein